MCKKTTNMRCFRSVMGILSLFMLVAFPCHGGVILEDNFDGHADWNVNGAKDGKECVSLPSELCSAGDYPNGYNFFRSMPYDGQSPAARISTLPSGGDHTTGSGKAFIVKQAGASSGSWTSDGMLGKFFGTGAAYPELYIRYWAKTQGSYQTVIGGGTKILRLGSWNGAGGAFSWDHPQTPAFFFDWARDSDGAGWKPSYRCSDGSSGYYCTGTNGYQATDNVQYWRNITGTIPTGRLPNQSGGYADGTWHRYDFHIKYNSAPGVADGIVDFKLDGVQMQGNLSSSGSYPATNVIFRKSGSTKTGFNLIAIGGNTNNWYGSGSQWFAIDDLVVSTTPIPDNYIIGGGAAAAPASPKNVTGTKK